MLQGIFPNHKSKRIEIMKEEIDAIFNIPISKAIGNDMQRAMPYLGVNRRFKNNSFARFKQNQKLRRRKQNKSARIARRINRV